MKRNKSFMNMRMGLFILIITVMATDIITITPIIIQDQITLMIMNIPEQHAKLSQ
jgi:hypothetical protein